MTVLDEPGIILLLFCAAQGLTRNARMLVRELERRYRSFILVANKWDLVTATEQGKYFKVLRSRLKFLQHVPMVAISAKTGKNIKEPMEEAFRLWDRYHRRVETQKLIKCISRFQMRCPPPGGSRIKFAKQVGVCPPHFVLFRREKKQLDTTYLRALRNELIYRFNLEGVFIKVSVREEKR